MILIGIRSSCSDDIHADQSVAPERAVITTFPFVSGNLLVDHVPAADSSMSACTGPAPSEVTMCNVPFTLPPLEANARQPLLLPSPFHQILTITERV
jgi:hypothetical protein